MGPRIEHASVVVFIILGQGLGHLAVRMANQRWHLLPDSSGWLVATGIVVGLVAYPAIIWGFMGLVILAGKCGFIDLDSYNRRHPGMQ